MNGKTIASWVVAVLLALAFLGAGAAKLTTQPMMLQEFARFGYPTWFMYVTGILEVVGAIAVLVPRYAFYGAALLTCIMLGAIFSHLTHGQAAMIGAPVVLFVLALLLVTLRRAAALQTSR
jgi:uncharacterized membrane protein YphA (DoxX/SURF4 family)